MTAVPAPPAWSAAALFGDTLLPPAGAATPAATPPRAAAVSAAVPPPLAGSVGPVRSATRPVRAVAPEPSLPERRRNEIMQTYLSYRRLDSFDLLGADEEASPAEVEGKYLEMAQRFAPWELAGPDLAGMEEKARDIFLAGARAYAELLDLELRNALLFRRRAKREERSRPPADMAIKTDLLDPEVQYRKGRALMDTGKFQEAAVLLEFASDCDPQNGLYSAELAHCRFCISPGQGAKAIRELQETLRRDPECGLAVFYAGEIHRQMGNRAEAEPLLRRAIKMMAPDRRPIEALKALAADKRK
jgi:tetratricopeptide (TPR) repeat protein